MSWRVEVHEFAEDVADGSMCLCGIPGLYHDEVMSRLAAHAEPTATEGDDR